MTMPVGVSTRAGMRAHEAGRYAYPSFVIRRHELPVGPVAPESDTAMHKLDALDQASRSDIPAFRAGDTVKVHVKVVEEPAPVSRSSRAS